MAVALTSRTGPPPATLAFYDREADAYCRSTRDNDLSALYPRLLERTSPGGLLLDAGCGSGRDMLAFLQRGYRVEAFDASAPMAALATALTGVAVEVARFEEWRAPPCRYDGIWAFASLLHVPRADLPNALERLAGGLRVGGHLFASFKRGVRDGIDEKGRQYTNLSPSAARALFDAVQSLETVEAWREPGPTGLGEATDWTYLVARRTS